jgi:hypothetical protein
MIDPALDELLDFRRQGLPQTRSGHDAQIARRMRGTLGMEGLLMDNSPAADAREMALLICCARAWQAPEKAKQIRALLQENVDWSNLVQSAS